MIFTQDIEEIIKTCIYTGFVKGEKPVNLMLVAPPEHGKSQLLLKYSILNNPAQYIMNDFTITALRKMMDQLKQGKIKHIVCPDFIKIVSRKQATVENLITMLNALIEEGIIRIDIYGFTFESPTPVGCGMMTAITPATLNKKKIREFWEAIGLRSRMVFTSWKYTKEQKQEIKKMIRQQKYYNEKPVKLKLPSKQQGIILREQDAERLNPIIESHIKQANETIPGFRFQKQLQTLLKARAIINKHKEVTEQEIKEIEYLSQWLNLEGNPLSPGAYIWETPHKKQEAII